MATSHEISVVLEPELYQELQKIAQNGAEQKKISELVCVAVGEWIKNNKKKQEELLKNGYEALGEINVGLAELCLEADNQALCLSESE